MKTLPILCTLPIFCSLFLACLTLNAQAQQPYLGQQPLPTARTYPVNPAGAQPGAVAQPSPTAQPGFTTQRGGAASTQESTVITAEKLTFDYKQAFALFEQNVVVDDPGIFLTCDNMEVKFDAQDEVESIIARGQVQIQQEDFAARAEVATYDVKSGDILLEVNPVVRKGQDLLKGGVIRYNRFDEKLVSTGGVRLILSKKEGGRSALGRP